MTQIEIETSILTQFKKLNSKPNHTLPMRWVRFEFMAKLTPKEQALVIPAIDSLVHKGLITETTQMGGCLVLTQKGFDTIFPLDPEAAIRRVKELILDGFNKRQSKVGHSLDQRWISQVLLPQLTPREVDVLDQVAEILVEEKLMTVEDRGSGVLFFLTQKGFDAIY